MTNDERIAALRRMCGYVENGSETSLHIHQDDATRSWIVRVGNRWWHGTSMLAAIDAAAADFPVEEAA